MKTKPELQADLTAAGIPFNETLTVPQLQELAKANNIDIKRVAPPKETLPEILEEIIPEPVLSLTDEAIIAEKVRAGLRYEDAVKVLKEQRAHDAAQIVEALV